MPGTAVSPPGLDAERLPDLERTVAAEAGDFEVEPLAGLEPSRGASPAVSVASLPGLEPTAAAAPASIEVEPLPGLEPTWTAETVEVRVERMPGLVTNEEALGADYRLESGTAAQRACARCGASLAGATICPECGQVAAAAGPRAVPQRRRCPQCGAPNSSLGERCAACGARL